MLLIDIHQLDIVFTQPIRVCALEHQIDHIGSILRLEREYILVLCSSKYFRKGSEVDAKSNVSVTAERGEHLGFEHHGDKGHVGVVHGLESDAGVIAVEVTVLDEILDGVDNLDMLVDDCANCIGCEPFSELPTARGAPPTLRDVSTTVLEAGH